MGTPAEVVDRLALQVLQVTVVGVGGGVVLGQPPEPCGLLLEDASQVVRGTAGLHVVDRSIRVGAEDVGELTAQRVVGAGGAAGDELKIGDKVTLASGLCSGVGLGVAVVAVSAARPA